MRCNNEVLQFVMSLVSRSMKSNFLHIALYNIANLINNIIIIQYMIEQGSRNKGAYGGKRGKNFHSTPFTFFL